MRGLRTDRTAQVIIAGHEPFMQNLRRGHYELTAERTRSHQGAAAFAQLALAI